MAAKTGTYTLIASNTLGSNTASVTFGSIPATYTDLKIVSNGRTDWTTNEYEALYMQLNSDTATNYSVTALMGTGSAAASYRQSTQNQMEISRFSNSFSSNTAFGTSIIDLQDYSNTTTYKTAISRTNNVPYGYYNVGSTVGLWRSTAAVSTIKLYPALGSNFVTGSTFKLYGIEAAK